MRAYIIILVFLAASCSERSSQHPAKENLSQKIDSLDAAASTDIDRDSSWARFHAKYSFSSMHIEVYEGKLAMPDFNSIDYGKDEKFRQFIQERLIDMPVNFGGGYTIIEKSCGAMCSGIYLIDRKTGKIFSFPATDGHWGYKYYPNSTLLLANSSLVNDSMTKFLNRWGIVPEFYQWTGKSFLQLP